MAPSNRKIGSENIQYKAAERMAFFKRLDRGVTIRAVALELGISPDSAYLWHDESGVSTRRQANRRYTVAKNSDFFNRLAIHPNVSAVARELGFVRVTCYKWAYATGIFTGRDVSAQGEKFLAPRKEGVSRAQAAERTSIDKRSARQGQWNSSVRWRTPLP